MGDDDQRPGLPASAGHCLTARVAAGAGPEAKMLIGRPDDPHNPCRVAAVKGLSFRLGVDRGTHLGQRPRAAPTGHTHDRDRTAPAFFRPHPLHHRGRPHALHLLSNTRSEPSTGEFSNGIQEFREKLAHPRNQRLVVAARYDRNSPPEKRASSMTRPSGSANSTMLEGSGTAAAPSMMSREKKSECAPLPQIHV